LLPSTTGGQQRLRKILGFPLSQNLGKMGYSKKKVPGADTPGTRLGRYQHPNPRERRVHE
jgi:hypothetical protein